MSSLVNNQKSDHGLCTYLKLKVLVLQADQQTVWSQDDTTEIQGLYCGLYRVHIIQQQPSAFIVACWRKD